MSKMHSREMMLMKLEADIGSAINNIMLENSDITHAEYLSVLLSVFNSFIGNMVKHMIRYERHQDDPDKPGGWE